MTDAWPATNPGSLLDRVGAASDAMMFVTSLEPQTLWVNDKLVELTGYSFDDYRFGNFENPFIPSEDLAVVGAFLGAFLGSDETVSGIVRNRFVDRWGGTLHVRSRISKIHYLGQPALLYTTVLDEVDPAVEVELRYRSLVEAATDAIVRLRSDLTVQYSNRFFQSLIARKPAVLKGTEFPELALPEHRSAVREQLETLQGRAGLTFPLQGPDGAVWVEGQFVRIKGGSDAGMIQAILRDTTERRLLEQRVQQAQKRETVGQLAAGIAHDLNNLLTGILATATLVEMQVNPGPVVSNALDDIAVATQRAGQLVHSMLAYAREGAPQKVAVDVAALVAEMRPLLATAVGRHIQLEIRTPAAQLTVLADEIELRQVVMNFIVNAADASAESPSVVSVVADRLEGPPDVLPDDHLFGQPPTDGPIAFVRVRDRGCGMTPEVLERIFDPFFSTKSTGRGLGLAAVKGILDRHGGCVRVRSAPGRGTEMEVWLPLSQAPVPFTTAPAHRADALIGEGAILLVDDENLVRGLARRIFERAGFEVLEARGRVEVMQLLLERSQDVRAVVLDQTRLKRGGGPTLAEIRSEFPTLPVVRTSGNLADTEAAGADVHTSYLGKPFGSHQLLDAVQVLIGLGLEGAPSPPPARPIPPAE